MLRELKGRGTEEGGTERCNKNKVIGNGEKDLLDWIIEKGWEVLNGKIEGDWEEEFTYVGARSNSVIDYAVIRRDNVEEINVRIKSFKIGNRMDTDHLPLKIEIEKKKKNRR